MKLTSTYVHLDETGGAIPVPVGASFWQDLMAGSTEIARRIAAGGWLVTAYEVREDMKHWEMHPEGEEILVLLSGAVDIVFETRTVAMRAGDLCIVPRGAWHQQRVRAPGQLLAITYGRGTQHRTMSP